MAKFCGKCGKSLQDGEICSCSLGNEQEQVLTSVVSPVQENKEMNVDINGQSVEKMNSQSIQGVQQVGGNGYSYGQVTQGQPMQGQPMQGQPMQGQPMQGQPMQGQPMQGQPMQGQPMQGQPMQGQPMQGQPMQGQPMQGHPNSQTNQFSQQASQAAAAAGKYAKNTWQVLLDIWKAPADNLKSFVNENNFVNALIIIGVEAVLTILFSCFLLRKAYAMIMGLFGGITYYFTDQIKVPYLSTILTSLIGTALGACIFAAITMFIVKQFGKANKTFKEAICISATKSAAILPFLAVAVITSLFSLPLSIIVLALGGILGYYYIHTALNDGSIQDENKRVYTTFLIVAINIIVNLILMYLYYKIKS